MKVNFKLLCFALVLLERCGAVVAGLRFEQLVKFSCEICNPDPDECCVGTVIHKDVILTTSYCATSCQSIRKYDRNIEIINTYKQPRMEAKTRHDIALVIANVDWTLNGVADLSPNDPKLYIGSKAYYPFMDDGNTRMRQMIISICGRLDQHIYVNHVCGSKNTTITTKKCFQRQGVPLLLDGKIIAIAAATNNKLCSDEQIVFNTLSPELPWIKMTIEGVFPLEVIGLPTTSTISSVTFHDATTTTILTPSTTQTPPTPPSTQTTPTTQPDSTTVTQTTPSLETGTTLTEEFIASPIVDRTDTPSEEENLIDGEKITDAASLVNTQTTNAMDWFNQKVRNKLKSGNYSFFVLTTTKNVYTTPFVDLTV